MAVKRKKRKIHNKETILNNSVSAEIKPNPLIYMLIKNNEIVYVGQTTKGFQRILHHYLDKDFDKIFTQPCNNKDLDKLEVTYIIKYRPKYNTVLPRNNEYRNMYGLKEITGLYANSIKKALKNENIEVAFHWDTGTTQLANYYYKLDEALQAVNNFYQLNLKII